MKKKKSTSLFQNLQSCSDDIVINTVVTQVGKSRTVVELQWFFLSASVLKTQYV